MATLPRIVRGCRPPEPAIDPETEQRLFRRPTPPELEFRCPECSICGKETDSDGDGFECEGCRVSWSADGRQGHYADDTEPGCNDAIYWFDTDRLEDQYERIRYSVLHCYLPHEHAGDHKDVEYSTWRDDDNRRLALRTGENLHDPDCPMTNTDVVSRISCICHGQVAGGRDPDRVVPMGLGSEWSP